MSPLIFLFEMDAERIGCGVAWGTPSRFFEMYSPKLPVATHPTAPKGMPDVAFIHNFGVRTMLYQQQLSTLA